MVVSGSRQTKDYFQLFLAPISFLITAAVSEGKDLPTKKITNIHASHLAWAESLFPPQKNVKTKPPPEVMGNFYSEFLEKSDVFSCLFQVQNHKNASLGSVQGEDKERGWVKLGRLKSADIFKKSLKAEFWGR